MSEPSYLNLQNIDLSFDDASNDRSHQDDIVLGDDIDENTLVKYWEKVVKDIHQDPDWFTFES